MVRFTPPFGTSPVLGLDIGSSSIKWALLRTGLKGSELLKCGMITIPRSKEPMVNRVMEMATLISQNLENEKIRVKSAVTALSDLNVIVRQNIFPFMPEDHITQMVQSNPADYFPKGKRDVALGVQILDRFTEGKERKVKALIVAANNQEVQLLTDILSNAGVAPEGISVGSFALLSSLQLVSRDSFPGTTAFIDIGARSTKINIIKENLPIFTRAFPLAGNALTEAVQRELVIDFEEAEKLKCKHGRLLLEPSLEETAGAKKDMETKVPAAMRPKLLDLLMEIRRSISYHQTQSIERDIDRLIITGGTAKLENLDKFLAKGLKIPEENVLTGDPFKSLRFNPDSVSPEFIKENRSQFSVAVGLGLYRSNLKNAITVNFAPKDIVAGLAARGQQVKLAAALVLMLLSSIPLMMGQTASTKKFNAKLDEIKVVQKQRSEDKKHTDALLKQFNGHKEELNNIFNRLKAKTPWSEMLLELQRLCAETEPRIGSRGEEIWSNKVTINTFSSRNKHLNIKATTFTNQMVMDFLAAMRASPWFDKIIYKGSTQQIISGKPVINFSLNCELTIPKISTESSE